MSDETQSRSGPTICSASDNHLRRVDILLRTWCPAEKQNEIREAINIALRGNEQEEFAIHLGKRLQVVVLAARKMVDRLHEVHAHWEYQAVWAVSQSHRGPYQGPKYENELKELEAVLANSDVTPNAELTRRHATTPEISCRYQARWFRSRPTICSTTF